MNLRKGRKHTNTQPVHAELNVTERHRSFKGLVKGRVTTITLRREKSSNVDSTLEQESRSSSDDRSQRNCKIIDLPKTREKM